LFHCKALGTSIFEFGIVIIKKVATVTSLSKRQKQANIYAMPEPEENFTSSAYISGVLTS
jgi:hypothetical protein